MGRLRQTIHDDQPTDWRNAVTSLVSLVTPRSVSTTHSAAASFAPTAWPAKPTTSERHISSHRESPAGLSTSMPSVASLCCATSSLLLLVCLALLLSSSGSGVAAQIPHSRSRAYQQQEEHEVNRLVSLKSHPLHNTAQHNTAG